MIGEVRRHGVVIVGYEDSLFALGPEEKSRVEGAQRQVDRVADAYHVKRINPLAVVPLNGAPERPTQMLVQHVAEGHDSGAFLRPACLHAPAEFRGVWPGLRSRGLAVEASRL